MTLLRMIAKLFILCMLGNAVLVQGGKTESNNLPKNIILLLVGGLSSDANIPGERGLAANGSLNNVQSRSPVVLLSEKMPICGAILPGDVKKNASGVDIGTLKIIFNGQDLEDSGNDTSLRSHSNLMHLAQQAGKATGLVTTVDITSEIPATIYEARIESSDSNCSEGNNKLLNLNIILGQPPVNYGKIKKCLFNYTYYSDPKSLSLKLQEGSEATSKEMKNDVLGLFPHVGPEDLKYMTSAALKFLRKKENGFFLVVTITGRPIVATKEMATQFLEELLNSDLLLETLVVATSVEEKVPCCKLSPTNGTHKRPKSNVQPPSVLKSKPSNDRTKLAEMKNTLNKKIHTETSTLKESNQKTRKSEDDGNISPSEITSKSRGVSEDSEILFTKTTNTSGSEHLPTPELSTEKYEYYSTVGISAQLSANMTTSYLPTGSTVSNEQYSSMYDEMITSLPPSSAASITPSLPPDTDVNGPPDADGQQTTYFSDFSSAASEVDVLPTTESVSMIENKLHQNETEEGFGNIPGKRNKRGADSDTYGGIPIYASGPGSSSFNRTLMPLDMREVLEMYISPPCEAAQFSELKGKLEVNCSGKNELSAMHASSSSVLIESDMSLLFVFGIAVMYIIVIMN